MTKNKTLIQYCNTRVDVHFCHVFTSEKARKLDANCARGIFHSNNRHNWANLVSYFSFESSSSGLILFRVEMNIHLQNHKQLFKSNLKEELVSWEQNIQFHIHANFRTLRWRHVQKRWIWKFYVKDISNERPGRVSRCSYQTSILFWRSSFSWRSQWANIYFFFYNWLSSLCNCSSFQIHMLSLTASKMKFVILFYSINTQQ